MHATKAHFKAYWVQYLIAVVALGFDISMRFIAHSLDAQSLQDSSWNALLGGRLEFFYGKTPTLQPLLMLAGIAAWGLGLFLTRYRWTTLACFLFMVGVNNLLETYLLGSVKSISISPGIIAAGLPCALGMAILYAVAVIEVIFFVCKEPSNFHFVRKLNGAQASERG